MKLEDFRESVLEYLLAEQGLVKAEIESNKQLSDDEKVEKGLLIRGAMLISLDGENALYQTDENLTKLRPGDRVCVVGQDCAKHMSAVVVSNDIASITICGEKPDVGISPARIEVVEFDNYELLIKLFQEQTRGGLPGAGLLRILANETAPRSQGLGALTELGDDEIPSSLNDEQRKAVRMVAKCPSVAYIQGTPGSGKTHLLACIARVFCMHGYDVAVVALTHQAVNNALNAIKSVAPEIGATKLGDDFKSCGLIEGVLQHGSFKSYLAARKAAGGFYSGIGDAVGMTFQSALINLGFRKSGFNPRILLVDEAGQIPMPHAAVVGAFGCGSIVFIGDDAQMPPIYREELKSDQWSVSVFKHLKGLYPNFGVVLNVTYRMCSELAAFVSKRYYEPDGIHLVSDSGAKGNQLLQQSLSWRHLCPRAIDFVTCSCPGATDENSEEADRICTFASKLLNAGLNVDRLAIITPFRRQGRLIRAKLSMILGQKDLPLIDTVERLQGQDVDVILLSFSVDDESYLVGQNGFVDNRNRLNVMYSRATTAAIAFGSSMVKGLLGL